MKNIVVAIDGYSACGKSTTAKAVAKIIGYSYIDSGAMYRAVTLYFLNHHVTLSNAEQVKNALSRIKISFQIGHDGRTDTYLNGECVENKIREMFVSEHVSEVSTLGIVRHELISQQKQMGREKAIVMDGRDIGTAVFTDAEVKLFMTADITVRALRRQQELFNNDTHISLQSIIKNIKKRDTLDTTRENSPLRKAADTQTIDTTHLTIDEQIDEVVRIVLGKII